MRHVAVSHAMHTQRILHNNLTRVTRTSTIMDGKISVVQLFVHNLRGWKNLYLESNVIHVINVGDAEQSPKQPYTSLKFNSTLMSHSVSCS